MIYHLKGTLIRKKGQECDYIEVNELFKDINPLVAREKAFSKFQSYLEVFLDSIGKRYVTYEQAVVDLQDFVNSYKRTVLKTPNGIITVLHTDFDKGLCLYFVEDENDTFVTLEGETIYNNKHLIRCFDKGFVELAPYIKQSLKHEKEVYKQLGLTPNFVLT
jgi:hypothetical protein